MDCLCSAVPLVAELLDSATVSDAIKAVEFVVTARLFHIHSEQLQPAIRRMLALVWHREAAMRAASDEQTRETESQLLWLCRQACLVLTFLYAATVSVRVCPLCAVCCVLVCVSVLEAYRSLYVGEAVLAARGAAQRKLALQAAESLVALSVQASLSELQSLDELISKAVHAKLLPPCVVDALLDMASASAGLTAQQRSGALLLLSFVANTGNEAVSAALPALVSSGLNGRAYAEPLLARMACTTTQRVLEPACAPSAFSRPASHDELLRSVLQRVEALLLDRRLHSTASADWYTAAEQSIRTLFLFHPQPERVMSKLLHAMTAAALSGPPTEPRDGLIGSAECLSRLLFSVGQVAVGTMVHVDKLESQCRKLRARRREQQQQQQSQQNDGGGRRKKQPAATAQKKEAAAASSAIEDDLAVGASEDYELEVMRDGAEKSLVALRRASDGSVASSSSLLAVYGPLLVSVTRQPSRYRHERLQSSAILSLCQLMCASAEFCAAHLPVVVTVMRHSSFAAVRINALVGLSDLASRHPNLVEPWSTHLYAALDDADSGVQLNGLLVLSHLLLNDMLKVKAAVVAMARCLVSTDGRIVHAARVFFFELSSKPRSPLLGVLPAVLSRLSADQQLSAPHFQSVFAFLLRFVDKDKHAEQLVDKLLQRLADRSADDDEDREEQRARQQLQQHAQLDGAAEQSQSVGTEAGSSARGEQNVSEAVSGSMKRARDVSYCLTQLSYSTGAVRRLLAAYKQYESKLLDGVVYEHFLAVVGKAKKFAKPDAKQVTDQPSSGQPHFHTHHTALPLSLTLSLSLSLSHPTPLCLL